MKLLVFSDIHMDKKALERLMAIEADMYVCAGDLVTWARGLDTMAELLKPRADKMFVLPGNHESESDIERVCRDFGFQNLHGKSIEVDGVHIAGLGYSNPTPFNTPGEYSEQQIADRLRPFASLKPLVLICHCPPKDSDLDGVKPGAHFGSTAVAEFIAAYEPVRFFCGHIHECEGRDVMVGHTRGVNVGKRGYLLDLATLLA
ncbi:MAG TPA: metallophosphoesterase [Bryobacteraceae bacterium]|nr:metallophosphoesterase [Bryobacteraceae bacterium]